MYRTAILKILSKSNENGGAIVLTRMLTDNDRQTDIMITIPLLPRGKNVSLVVNKNLYYEPLVKVSHFYTTTIF